MTEFTENIAGVFAPFLAEETADCLRLDLADLGSEEVRKQVLQAEQMIRGLKSTMEDINLPLYVALSSAQALIEEAREREEGHAVSPSVR